MSINDQFVMTQVLLKCPYQPLHIVPQSSFHKHLTKCKSTYKHMFRECPYNTYHHILVQQFQKHCKECPQRFKFMSQNENDWVDEIQDDTISQKTIRTKINTTIQKKKCLTQYQNNQDHQQDDWDNNSYLSIKSTKKQRQKNPNSSSNIELNIKNVQSQNLKSNKFKIQQNFTSKNPAHLNPQMQNIPNRSSKFGIYQPIYSHSPQYHQLNSPYYQTINSVQNQYPQYIHGQQGFVNGFPSSYNFQPNLNQFPQFPQYPQYPQQYFNNNAPNFNQYPPIYAKQQYQQNQNYDGQGNMGQYNQHDFQNRYYEQYRNQGQFKNNGNKKGKFQYYQYADFSKKQGNFQSNMGYNQPGYNYYDQNYYGQDDNYQEYYQNSQDYYRQQNRSNQKEGPKKQNHNSKRIN